MHSESCQSIPIQAVSVVKEKISFKSWSTTEETLFRIYADFECILQECNEEDTIGKTIQVRKHIPCSVAWVLIFNHPEVESRSMLFRPSSTSDSSTEDLSEQVVDKLMTSLQALEEELLPYQEEVIIRPRKLLQAIFHAARLCTKNVFAQFFVEIPQRHISRLVRIVISVHFILSTPFVVSHCLSAKLPLNGGRNS